jgi:CheY-like chemotaxis protein
MISNNSYFPQDLIYDPTVVFMNDNIISSGEIPKKSVSTGNDVFQQVITIVLADDDEDDRDLFKEAIETIVMNINIEFAHDGKCLMEILSSEKVLPDLIFLDLNMPHLTGTECLDEIRKDERLKNIPVVIYSTSSSNKDIEETFEKGANLYVTKPSSFTELAIITRKVLSLDWNNHKPHASRNQFLFNSETK